MDTTDISRSTAFDQLLLLPSGSSQIKFLSCHGLISSSTVKRMDEAVSLLVRIDLNRADQLASAARSLLVSLWDVNDSGTAMFMKIFYNRIGHRSDRASALRHAMQTAREQHPHPYYPSVLVGVVLP
jgi:hypothetical protein